MPPMPTATRISTNVKAGPFLRLVNVALHSILGNECAHLQRLRNVLIGPSQSHQRFPHVIVIGGGQFEFADVDGSVVSHAAIGVASAHTWKKWRSEGRRHKSI